MATTYNLIHDRIHHDLTFLRLDPANANDDADIPLVIVLHGLRSVKESVLETCYNYARAGYRAIAPDLRLHGERDHADTRDARLEDSYVQTMLTIIEKSVADISALVDHFGASKAAIHGISLGGIISFSALLADPRLAVATIAMGSPDWGGLLEMMGVPRDHPQFHMVEAYSPLAKAEGIAPRAVLMMHGDLDDVVPIQGARALRKKLEPLYAEHPHLLELVEYEGVGHIYTDDMIKRSVSWVERYL
jgi:hypothetical protein